MVSERDNRQRAAARAKLEREMAARAEAAQRKRLMQARIGGGVAAVVVLAAVIWIITAAVSGDEPAPVATGPTACEWLADPNAYETPGAPSPRAGVKDLGEPPTDVPRTGFQVLNLETNLGVVKVEMDLSKTPCTAASLAYLAGKKFYDGSSCHRLVASIFALQCGDPSGTGSGGVTYKVPDENLPVGKLPAYHEGDVAMANTGQPDTNGTQFFFLYGNTPLDGKYSLFGRVIEGLDIIKKVAAGGDDGAYEQQAGGGKPKVKFSFVTVTAGPVTPQSQASPTTPPAVTSPTAPASSGTPTTTSSPVPSVSASS